MSLSLWIAYHTHGQHNVDPGLPCAFLSAVIYQYLDILLQNVMM